MSDGVHPLIRGLILELPELNEPMDDERRAAWLDASRKVVELLWPTPVGDALPAALAAEGNEG